MLKLQASIPVLLVATLSFACTDDDGNDSTSDAGTGTSTTTSSSTDAGAATASAGSDASTGSTSGVGMESSGTSGDLTGTEGETGDSGGGICQEACDLFDQEACGEGRRCVSFLCTPGNTIWDGRICAASGPKLKGESCRAQMDPEEFEEACGRGLMCFNGTCIDHCIGSEANPTCPDPNEACVIANEGNIAFCTSKCDPLILDCAGDGTLCVPNEPVNNAFICVPPAENVAAADESCSEGAHGCANCCAPGTVCAEPGKVDSSLADCSSDYCCASLCELDKGEGQCQGQEMCLKALQTDVPGYENLGVCQIPVQ